MVFAVWVNKERADEERSRTLNFEVFFRRFENITKNFKI